jgi:hypothetical protein
MSNNRVPAVLIADWGSGRKKENFPVQYNPKEFTLEKQVQYGEIAIPGLEAPLQQFVRGQAEKLTVELFFDTTENGLGKDAVSVTKYTDRVYKLTKVENSSHAPPVVTFCWDAKFPGSEVNGGGTGSESGGNQARNSFVGIAESVRQQFTLFSSEGVPLRATVNLVLREFRPLDEQLKQLRLNSPDRTHAHPLQAGETLTAVAAKYYGNAARWRHIADANDLGDPRRTTAGRILHVPSIK